MDSSERAPKPRQKSIPSFSTSRYPVVIYVLRADGSIDRICPNGQQRVPNIRGTVKWEPRRLGGSKPIPLQLLLDSSDDHSTSIRSTVFIREGLPGAKAVLAKCSSRNKIPSTKALKRKPSHFYPSLRFLCSEQEVSISSPHTQTGSVEERSINLTASKSAPIPNSKHVSQLGLGVSSGKSMAVRKELIEDCLEVLRAVIVLQGEIADREKRLAGVKITRGVGN